MNGEIINIVLVLRTGGEFNLMDAILLSHHAIVNEENNTVQILCLTDLNKVDIVHNYFSTIPLEYNWQGWWSKMNLFSPKLEYLRPFLYIDLDTAIIAPISSILPDVKYRNGVIMLRDFYCTKRPASGILWIPAKNEKVKKVWNEWIKYPKTNMLKFRGDQEFISSVIQPDYYWQDIVSGVVSYKPNKRHRIELQGNENIVCFHGHPKIMEASKESNWVMEYVKGV